MVRGYLKFEKIDKVQASQHVMIVVEDTSRVDAGSVQVARTIAILPENFDFEHDVLPFEIDLRNNSDTLTIRAHMPTHSGTDIRLGDMITTAAIPVRWDRDIEVPLHPVV
jgi:hypothetical protein